MAARRVGRGAARPQGGTTPPGTPARLVHGGPFEIVETDGNPVQESARVLKDTVKVGPGEHYDVVWEAREPRQWLLLYAQIEGPLKVVLRGRSPRRARYPSPSVDTSKSSILSSRPT